MGITLRALSKADVYGHWDPENEAKQRYNNCINPTI